MLKFQHTLKKLGAGISLILIAFSAHSAFKPNEIQAKSFLLIDYNSGKVLADKAKDEPLPIGSFAKLMTAYLVGNAIQSGQLKLSDHVRISENAWSGNFPGSSKMFFEKNANIKVDDLLNGLLVQSGNDAGMALAEAVAGSEAKFLDMMNQEAKKLGMKNTTFTDVNGLADGDSDQPESTSTSADLAILASAFIRHHPELHQRTAIKKFTFSNITQYNRNKLLWNEKITVDGLKSSYSNGGGYNLLASSTKGNIRLISVMMGTPSQQSRVVESEKLLTYGYRLKGL